MQLWISLKLIIYTLYKKIHLFYFSIVIDILYNINYNNLKDDIDTVIMIFIIIVKMIQMTLNLLIQ